MTTQNGIRKSNWIAAVLGLTLGPVGLWYKRRWAEGWTWLIVIVLFGIGPGGMGLPLLPFFLIAMCIASAWADVGPG
jgi:hypothetical protein